MFENLFGSVNTAMPNTGDFARFDRGQTTDVPNAKQLPSMSDTQKKLMAQQFLGQALQSAGQMNAPLQTQGSQQRTPTQYSPGGQFIKG